MRSCLFHWVNNWKKAEKYIHNKLAELGIKRFQGREWFKCKPNDVKSVFDECKKLYEFNAGEIKEDVHDNKVMKVKQSEKNNHSPNESKKYYCNLCDYETIDSGNFAHHKKHIRIINEGKLKEYEVIKKERNELKIMLLEKDIEIKHLKELVEIYKNLNNK